MCLHGLREDRGRRLLRDSTESSSPRWRWGFHLRERAPLQLLRVVAILETHVARGTHRGVQHVDLLVFVCVVFSRAHPIGQKKRDASPLYNLSVAFL